MTLLFATLLFAVYAAENAIQQASGKETGGLREHGIHIKTGYTRAPRILTSFARFEPYAQEGPFRLYPLSIPLQIVLL